MKLKLSLSKWYPLYIFLMVISIVSGLILPILFSQLIDDIIIGGEFEKLNNWGIKTSIFVLFSCIFQYYFVRYMPVKIGIKNAIQLRIKSLSNVLRMNVPLFEKQEKGYYYNIIMNSCSIYGDLYEEIYLHFIACIFCIIIILGYIFYKNIVFGILFLVYSCVLGLASAFGSKPLFYLQKEALVKQDGWLNDMRSIVENKKGINALNAEIFFENEYKQSSEETQKYVLRFRFFELLADYIPSFVNVIYNVVFLFIGAVLVQKKEITPGVMLLGYQLLSYLAEPISDAVKILIRYQAGKEHIKRVDDLECEAGLKNEVERLAISEKNLFETKELVFEREIENEPLYTMKNIELEKNKFYVIKGENGTGKSMFLNMLLGNVSKEKLKGDFFIADNIEKTAFLTYPFFTVNGNFEKNLFGMLFDEKLLEILQIDFADKTITSNPINLSYGQQQKLALLRIFSMESEILFLDEPLSNLDIETQNRVVEYVKQLKGQKTILVIMHSDEFDEVSDSMIKIENNELFLC